MSLEIVRQVSREHPDLLQQNLGSTCYQHTLFVVEGLIASGHNAALMCKSPSEGQYVPPGFKARVVTGLDGKQYPCSGVSHDAIWCDGKQYDTIAQANDSEDPIGMLGIPIWNEIPAQYWRANNPPLPSGPAPKPVPVPQPPQPPLKVLPKDQAFTFLKALDAFYRSDDGLKRPEGVGGDMEAIAQWFYQGVIEAKSIEDVKAQIRTSDEWKSKHP